MITNHFNLLFYSNNQQTKSSSNLGLDFLLSNRSMKRRCSAASMLGHQTQRKAEDLIDAGMKSVVSIIQYILKICMSRLTMIDLFNNTNNLFITIYFIYNKQQNMFS